tara:strand:- start:61 stop:522 length:462 start_codon:yes stop_codon:yes gene_type:complete
MLLTKNFDIQEFVPMSLYKLYGDSCIRFIDNRIPLLAQAYKDILTELYKEEVLVTINNKYKGGQFNERGFREFDTTTGALYSDHKYGRAFDSSFSLRDGRVLPIKEVYQKLLLRLPQLQLIGLTTFEDLEFSKTWLHSSVRYTNTNKITIVKP